ncbi:Six-hairpin glycosidase-like protein [Auriculariales sp. MPI-PUGE-AT-0066]|nr:Six-hairpin glycosidase-like protein [Auriculariales sp. MPI-PUGE-AT-0066]
MHDIVWGFCISLLLAGTCLARIDRHAVVTRYNPHRDGSTREPAMPMQVGNGNFAFGAGIDGLQTFQPWAIMSNAAWAWKNDTLPVNRTLSDINSFHGTSYWNHDKLVQYNFGSPSTSQDIEQWLIMNPNRLNLGRIGLAFFDEEGTEVQVQATELANVSQILDLWTGTLATEFTVLGEVVSVQTSVHSTEHTIGLSIRSSLLQTDQLGLFLDFPWTDGISKFAAPFVGSYAPDKWTSHHSSIVDHGGNSATLVHSYDSLGNATSYASASGDPFDIALSEGHRYILRPKLKVQDFSLAVHYSIDQPRHWAGDGNLVHLSSRLGWSSYWQSSGFIDLTGTDDPRAEELQRRIILSRYLMRVNAAGDFPEQESGLVNNGWRGKFHAEMFWWHLAHWLLWGNEDYFSRAEPYQRFLGTSIERAQVQQPWKAGARWGKMSDPSGRSSPGQINELLIWQQPHPLVFAEYLYRASPSKSLLRQWRDVVYETADWMAEFAWWNATTERFDIGPPMYVVSEDTAPNATINPSFELSYWYLGLDIASRWMERLGEDVPEKWTHVAENLAPLPVVDNLYQVYEGIDVNFWTNRDYINDHPALAGLFGWLPPTKKLDIAVSRSTTFKVWSAWNLTSCWGWDFPLLAMSAARIGEPDQAVSWLLHPLFGFDEVGMPTGGVRVATPYFPGSGGLLLAAAFMAEGWDGDEEYGHAPGFPKNWTVRVEGLRKAL